MWAKLSWLKYGVLACGLALMGIDGPGIAAAATTNAAIEQQIMADVNQDRVAAGMPALALDPRLTAVAEARAEYLIAKGYFSHCTGGEADVRCGQSGYDFAKRDQTAGLNLNAGGTMAAENLALNNYSLDSAAAQTNVAWLNSPEHKANIMDAQATYTGVGVACCFAGTIGGQAVSPSDNVYIYVQEFSGGPGATPTSLVSGATSTAPTSSSDCRFVLGFASLASLLPNQVGQCADDEQHSAQNGDAVQKTSTGGLLVWRKADNWTAFTDGFRTWVDGPSGPQERLNTQRFPWEANPAGLPIAS